MALPSDLIDLLGEFASSQAIEQRDRLGCVGVVTDAKLEAMGYYEGLGFHALSGVREGLLLAEPAPMFLGIETILATLEP